MRRDNGNLINRKLKTLMMNPTTAGSRHHSKKLMSQVGNQGGYHRAPPALFNTSAQFMPQARN